MLKHVLTIAGSDSSGGAGIQADIKSMSANGCYAMSVITAVTAQNTQGVTAVQDISPDMIRAQIDAVFNDISVDAVKIGMVSVPETIEVIAGRLKHYQAKPIVLDPVMISKSGFDLLQPEAKSVLQERLLPLATVVTPNVPEAEAMTNMRIASREDMKRAAAMIRETADCAVLLKGGHMEEDATDLLYDGSAFTFLPSKRIETKNTHGTGCSLSSALAARLALGEDLITAVTNAKRYVYDGILHAENLGHGWGPIHHFHAFYGKKNG